MSRNEEEVQKIRAQRLREQLARLKSGKTETEEEARSERKDPARESPHDFVQRRMREIAREEK
jgi:hypothetical protein